MVEAAIARTVHIHTGSQVEADVLFVAEGRSTLDCSVLLAHSRRPIHPRLLQERGLFLPV